MRSEERAERALEEDRARQITHLQARLLVFSAIQEEHRTGVRTILFPIVDFYLSHSEQIATEGDYQAKLKQAGGNKNLIPTKEDILRNRTREILDLDLEVARNFIKSGPCTLEELILEEQNKLEKIGGTPIILDQRPAAAALALP